jgi:hypothetical protein
METILAPVLNMGFQKKLRIVGLKHTQIHNIHPSAIAFGGCKYGVYCKFIILSNSAQRRVMPVLCEKTVTVVKKRTPFLKYGNILF